MWGKSFSIHSLQYMYNILKLQDHSIYELKIKEKRLWLPQDICWVRATPVPGSTRSSAPCVADQVLSPEGQWLPLPVYCFFFFTLTICSTLILVHAPAPLEQRLQVIGPDSEGNKLVALAAEECSFAAIDYGPHGQFKLVGDGRFICRLTLRLNRRYHPYAGKFLVSMHFQI